MAIRLMIVLFLAIFTGMQVLSAQGGSFDDADEQGFRAGNFISQGDSGTQWNRFELVFYPQIRIENVYVDKVYKFQLNIAPELRFYIYKGLILNAQVIFPIANQMEEEGDHIRPGIVTLNQSFRLGDSFYGLVSAGKFTNNRYGADIRVLNFFAGGRFTLGANAGLTGYDEFRDGQLVYSGMDTFTWRVQASYFIRHFNSMVNINYGRYLHDDHGFRLNAVRFFGRTAVGFWAMYSGSEMNGGFNVAIPIAPARFKTDRRFRVMPPEYFFWEYRGRIWPEEGQFYSIRNNYYVFDNTDPLKQFNLLTFN